ncbi:MAG: hypothetical protein JXB23_11035 [Candidatus Aminicenantes bacterium]|nr:hypothetical protein [Candidatus Aminicenantes bacterium]
MHESKLRLKIFDNGIFADRIEFKLYGVPSFSRDKVEEEIENLKHEILAHFKGKPIHASLFTEDMKTEFSYGDIGQLMVHHLRKVEIFFTEYYQYLKILSRIRLFVIAVSNMEDFPVRSLALSASFPPSVVLRKPEELPRKPGLTIFDRIPGSVHSMVESSFLRLLKFKSEKDAAPFLDDFYRKEKELGQFYKRKFHKWDKAGPVVTAGVPQLGPGKQAHFPVCLEIPDTETEKSFPVACKLSAENMPVSIDEEVLISFTRS